MGRAFQILIEYWNRLEPVVDLYGYRFRSNPRRGPAIWTGCANFV
jgi:hypothetical protein